MQAAIEGTTEVGAAVIASTLTTIAVFLPIVFVEGIAGQLFGDQALTVTFSLMVSVVAALLLQPVLASRMLRHPESTDGVIRKLELLLQPLLRAFGRAYDAFHDFYHGLLERALGQRAPMLILLVIFLLGVMLTTNAQLTLVMLLLVPIIGLLVTVISIGRM